MRARTRSDRLAVAAFAAAVVGALVAAFAPLGSACEATAVSGGAQSEVCSHVSTFSTDGSWVLVVVSVPVLVTLMSVLVRRRAARVVSAVLLWIGCLLGAWSVGMFFLPAAITMTIAAAQPDTAPVPPIPTG